MASWSKAAVEEKQHEFLVKTHMQREGLIDTQVAEANLDNSDLVLTAAGTPAQPPPSFSSGSSSSSKRPANSSSG